MATTLRQLTYRLWRLLDGGDISDDSRFKYRELKGYIISGIAFGLKQNAFEQRNSSDTLYGAGQYAKTTVKDVLFDDEGVPYIELKDKSLAFGGTRNFELSSGNPLSRWAKTFLTIRKEELFLQKMQANIPNVIQAIVEGNRILLFGNATLNPESLETVRLTQYFVIPDADDDDSELPLPSEYENQIIDQAYQIVMREIRPEDRANDGVPAI